MSYVELLILYAFGLVNSLCLRRLSLGICVVVSKFQCRLFLLVQALIFGERVAVLVVKLRALGSLPGEKFFPVLLLGTIVASGTLGGERCGVD